MVASLSREGWVNFSFADISVYIKLTDISVYIKLTFLYSSSAIITLTSQWARWRLKSPASGLFTQLFIQVQIKENIKGPRHWPLCGEFTGDRWIPGTKGQ